jgi:antitoxin component YwqK of YwqJK toxin-antitoxin module
MKNFLFVVLLTHWICGFQSIAQDDKTKTDTKPKSQTDRLLTTTTTPLIELSTKRTLAQQAKDIAKQAKETAKLGLNSAKSTKTTKAKKEPKNSYRGIKAKKSFIRTISGKRTIVEKFYFVKDQTKVPEYVLEAYYFDPKKQKIIKTTKYNPENGALLHGLYTKKVNDLVTEEGYFYLGVKDGKWEKYGKDTLLLDKRYYDKGFLQESEVEYFDKKKQKLKQLVSIHNGSKEGEYLLYFPSGRLATKGQYADNIKIGVWYEYFDQVKFARKREIKYQDEPYTKADSVVLREWDIKGKVLVDNSRK